jgi:non-heme chloroperoxidase
MSTFTTRDGCEIFYKDWGSGPPIVFSHGWPLNADAWDAQMMFFGEQGYRVIAHDRRGHGRSEQTWDRNDMDNYADDLAQLLDELDLRDATIVGHSTGGGEVTRYLGRHGTSRIARVVLLSAVPPIMLKAKANPNGLPISVFDQLRAASSMNRAQLFKDFALPFFGYNRKGAKISQGILDNFWFQAMQGGVKPITECIKAFSETDFTEDLKKIDKPTLIAHGDDDQIVPIVASAMLSSKLVRNSILKIYPGLPHGLAVTHQEQFNSDLLQFIESSRLHAEGERPPLH